MRDLEVCLGCGVVVWDAGLHARWHQLRGEPEPAIEAVKEDWKVFDKGPYRVKGRLDAR